MGRYFWERVATGFAGGEDIHPSRHRCCSAPCARRFATGNARGHPRKRRKDRSGQRKDVPRLHRVCQSLKTRIDLRNGTHEHCPRAYMMSPTLCTREPVTLVCLQGMVRQTLDSRLRSYQRLDTFTVSDLELDGIQPFSSPGRHRLSCRVKNKYRQSRWRIWSMPRTVEAQLLLPPKDSTSVKVIRHSVEVVISSVSVHCRLRVSLSRRSTKAGSPTS